MSSSVLLCPLWRPISQRTKLNCSYLKVCCSVQDHQLCKQVQLQALQVFLSPLSSSMAVKHGPYLLTLWKRSRPLKPRAWGNLSASPTWSARSTTGCRARSTPLWVHRNQEMETCIVRACHMLQQASPKHPSGHLRGWVMLLLAEEMLDGQHQGADIPAHARTVHKGLLQKRLEEDLCWIVSRVPLMTQSVKGLNWTEL